MVRIRTSAAAREEGLRDQPVSFNHNRHQQPVCGNVPAYSRTEAAAESWGESVAPPCACPAICHAVPIELPCHQPRPQRDIRPSRHDSPRICNVHAARAFQTDRNCHGHRWGRLGTTRTDPAWPVLSETLVGKRLACHLQRPGGDVPLPVLMPRCKATRNSLALDDRADSFADAPVRPVASQRRI
jgi:hypothetical protein